MRANPGGVIEPTSVVGRDELIDEIWRILETRHLQILSDRRYGKSCVIQKMAAEPRPGWTAVYTDLESERTPLGFVEVVYAQIAPLLSRRQRTATRLLQMVRDLSGLEVHGLKLPPALGADWMRLLQAVFQDLEEHLDGNLVFFWDEVPYMLQNVRDDVGEEAARQLLDALRAIRQTSRRTRMVFTGSIGLHHVLSSLVQSGRSAQAPTNDMAEIYVAPLTLEDAIHLARMLFVGESLPVADLQATAVQLAEGVGGVPYYVHHVVDAARHVGRIDPAAVDEIIDRSIRSPSDPWNLAHYRKRLRIYYGAREALALEVLDTVARADHPIPRLELVDLVIAKEAASDSEDVLAMLRLLQLDHYLVRDDEGSFRFASTIVARWWRHVRFP